MRARGLAPDEIPSQRAHPRGMPGGTKESGRPDEELRPGEKQTRTWPRSLIHLPPRGTAAGAPGPSAAASPRGASLRRVAPLLLNPLSGGRGLRGAAGRQPPLSLGRSGPRLLPGAVPAGGGGALVRRAAAPLRAQRGRRARGGGAGRAHLAGTRLQHDPRILLRALLTQKLPADSEHFPLVSHQVAPSVADRCFAAGFRDTCARISESGGVQAGNKGASSEHFHTPFVSVLIVLC